MVVVLALEVDLVVVLAFRALEVDLAFLFVVQAFRTLEVDLVVVQAFLA